MNDTHSSHLIQLMAAAAAVAVVMPAALKKQAEVRHHNGFGIQSPGTGSVGETYVLCYFRPRDDDKSTLVVRLREISGSTTLFHDDWIGRHYLGIHWTEYDKIEAVLTRLIELGYNFQLCCHSLPQFGPKQGDAAFAWRMVETRLMAVLLEWLTVDHLRPMVIGDQVHSLFSNCLDVWNWNTPEGKVLCQALRKARGMPIQDETTDKENYFRWKMYTDYDAWKAEQAAATATPRGSMVE